MSRKKQSGGVTLVSVKEGSLDLVSKGLLKPRKPVMPYLGKEPQREVLITKEICICPRATLADLLEEIPEGIDYKNIRICHFYEDEFYLEYDVLVDNANYEKDLVEYEKKKVVYEERLKLYLAQKKIYDEWEGLTEGEKRERDEERKRLIKQNKILQLEKQLEDLKKDVGGT